MWKTLSFKLKNSNDERILKIYSHFKDENGAYVDTGKYTVKEGEKVLGVLHVNLFTQDLNRWESDRVQFAPQELKQMADYIKLHDVGEEPV